MPSGYGLVPAQSKKDPADRRVKSKKQTDTVNVARHPG
jgi:hypothetical protein